MSAPRRGGRARGWSSDPTHHIDEGEVEEDASLEVRQGRMLFVCPCKVVFRAPRTFQLVVDTWARCRRCGQVFSWRGAGWEPRAHGDAGRPAQEL